MSKYVEITRRATATLPQFLAILRDLQPLILLSSFSLVIATFTAPISQTASGLAIAASMAFLSGLFGIIIARASSAVLGKYFDATPLTLGAYVSIGLGLILLYRIPTELANAIPTIGIYGRAGSAILYVLLAIWITDLFATKFREQKKLAQSMRQRAQHMISMILMPVGYNLLLASFVIEAVLPELRPSLLTLDLVAGGVTIVGVLALAFDRDNSDAT